MISAKDARALAENESERDRQKVERLFSSAIENAAQNGKMKTVVLQQGCTWGWIKKVISVLEPYGYKVNAIQQDAHHYGVEVSW